MEPDRSRQLRRLEELLLFPREDLDSEYKGWLDLSDAEAAADLAKATLALANYGGGWVVLGFDKGNCELNPSPGYSVKAFRHSQDDINGIVKKYAEPTFHCRVDSVRHPTSGVIHPVITVPSDVNTPVRSRVAGPNERHIKQNVYYTRRPGPSSEGIQTALEWDVLLRRCLMSRRTDIVESLRAVLEFGSADQNIPGRADALDTWHDESLARINYLRERELPD